MLKQILNQIENLEFDKVMDKNDKIRTPKSIPRELYLPIDGRDLVMLIYPELVNKYPKLIEEHANWIAEVADHFQYDTKSSTLKQIKCAILYMEHTKNNCNISEEIKSFNDPKTFYILGEECPSTFMLIRSVYYAILNGYGFINGVFNKGHIGQILFSLFAPEIATVKYPIRLPNYKKRDYTTQIIFDTADIASALDELANSFDNIETLWKIRNVWIQESLRDTFLQQIPGKLQKHIIRNDQLYDNNVQKTIEKAKKFGAANIIQRDRKYSTLIIGVNRNAIIDEDSNEYDVDTDNIVFVNYFRTPKELQTLLKNCVANQSISMWSENISIIYEMVHNLNAPIIWCNCIGILNPSIPFNFNCDSEMPWKNDDKNDLIPTNGVLVDGKYIFQRWQNVNPLHNHRTVVVAFGSTFAN